MSSGHGIRVLRASLIGAVALGSAVAIGRGEERASGAQQGGTTSPIVLPPLQSPNWGAKVPMTPERARAINEGHHKRAEADLEKMTGLMSELNDEFARAHPDEVSLGVVRKAKELEKLARDVQSQLKSVARERGSGEQERGGEVELGFLHVSAGGG